MVWLLSSRGNLLLINFEYDLSMCSYHVDEHCSWEMNLQMGASLRRSLCCIYSFFNAKFMISMRAQFLG